MRQFRSTPPHRGRRFDVYMDLVAALFRSTPPHRGRRHAERAWLRRCRFDPHPRTGGGPCASWGCAFPPVFRSTPPHRGRPACLTTSWPAACFDPHPRTGGGCARAGWCRRPTSFDPHPRTGGGGHRLSECSCRRRFDPHPRTGGGRLKVPSRAVGTLFRSTPPHRGRPLGLDEIFDQLPVSIHTPAQGAARLQQKSRHLDRFRSTPPHRGRPLPI